MAQSAVDTRKTPLHIDAFCEKAKITPPLVGEVASTKETRLAIKRVNSTWCSSQRTILRSHISTKTVYEEPVGSHTQARDTKRTDTKSLTKSAFFVETNHGISAIERLFHSSTLALAQKVVESSKVSTHIFLLKRNRWKNYSVPWKILS